MIFDDTIDELTETPDSKPPVRERLRRIVLGCGLLFASAGLAASLVTWRVDDPSLSHATDLPAQNLLGIAGASLADIAMQFFGLAASFMVVLLLILGACQITGQAFARPWMQALLGIVGIFFAAAALACLPVTAQWPLPTGLGGALGDLVLHVPAWFVTGELSGGARAAIGVISAGLGATLLIGACAPAFAAVYRNSPADSESDWDDEEDNDDTSWSSANRVLTWAGGLLHLVLTLHGQIRRLIRPARLATRFLAKGGPEPIPVDRTEPQFGAGINDGFAVPDAEIDAEFDPEFDPEFEGNEPGPAHRSPRIVKPALPPKPAAGSNKGSSRRAGRPNISGAYELPPLELLEDAPAQRRNTALNPAALEENARILEGVLDDFGVRGEIINIRPGPVVTMYELEPAPGIKSSRVIGLADDIARSMSAIAARVAVIPGRNVIGIELPNATRETVFLREILGSADFDKTRARLALTLGKTISGEPVIADLAKMPHLLVAGTTGSGKSVSINTMILSLLYRLTPQQCRLILIDPKMLELSVYDGIPHLLTPVVTDPKKAVVALKWTVREMEERYKKMSRLGVRNIDGFNQRIAAAAKKGEEITRTVQVGFDHETGEAIFETETLQLDPMPYIVVIIDEMADLMMVAGKDIEGTVQRLAQMARAAGIHVIMATQRPSVDVITGTIKANFPTRISFQVTSKIDSRTILGEQGAEQLLGMGDMLFMAGGGRIQRVHGPFVDDEEVEDVVTHLKTQGVPDYLESVTDDEDGPDSMFDALAGGSDESADLYDQAVAIVLRDRKASTSYVQRRLSIGYNRAASLIERMEQEGVIGPANHAGKREILVPEREKV